MGVYITIFFRSFQISILCNNTGTMLKGKGVISLSVYSHVCRSTDLIARKRYFSVGGEIHGNSFLSVRFAAYLEEKTSNVFVYI